MSDQLGNARRGTVRWSAGVAAVVCLAAGFGVASRSCNSSVPQAPWTLTRITADAGISDDPTLSPDGRLVAYSSDRSPAADPGPLAGQLDLYIKPVVGGTPVRLTFDGAGNRMPDFSPDGSRLVFRSNRDGGGIYEMPALGGDTRLIAERRIQSALLAGRIQSRVLVGPQSVAASVPGTGAIWVVSVAGGQPQRIGAQFQVARFPVWHKDGKHLLLLGYTSDKAFDSTSVDWWVVPINGSGSVLERAPMTHCSMRVCNGWALKTAGPGCSAATCWSSARRHVTFSIRSGDSDNLWEIAVSPQTGRWSGVPKADDRTGNDVHASCASAAPWPSPRSNTESDIWLLPFDLNRGVSTGRQSG